MAQSYKQIKPTGAFDALIIGSGMSGMALAALMSKAGKRCLVLERHYEPGGFTHVFRRKGYEWDVGVHYIGEVNRPHTLLRKTFDHITDGRLEWADMGDVYDRVIFGHQNFDFMKGTEPFRERMHSYFPGESHARAIDTYLSLIREAAGSITGLLMPRALPGIPGRLLSTFTGGRAKKFAASTTAEVLRTLTNDPLLTGVLTGQFGDYGLPPGESSFLMHAVLVKHYLNGAAYPVGGSGRIFETVESVLSASGSEVFTSAEVDRIVVEKGRATGVKMSDGSEIRAPLIISSTGAHVTYQQLLRDNDTTALTSSRISKIPYSLGHCCLYLGLNKTAGELRLPKSNLWLYPENPDHDANVAAFRSNPEQAPLPMVYASFPAAKDPDFERRFPGRSTIDLITLGDPEQFEPWKETRWMKRGEDYQALKDRLAKKMLDRLQEQMPGIADHIEHAEFSTPLSTRHFVNYPQGEIYGLTHSPARFASADLQTRTPVKGLYLTGQDLSTCGIGGALSAALITASVILRRNMFGQMAKS